LQNQVVSAEIVNNFKNSPHKFWSNQEVIKMQISMVSETVVLYYILCVLYPRYFSDTDALEACFRFSM